MLIVESGKKYIRKDGKVTGILTCPNLFDIIYNIEYCEDGKQNQKNDPYDNNSDLVCEYSKEVHDILIENKNHKYEIEHRDIIINELRSKYEGDIKLLRTTITSQIVDRDNLIKEIDKLQNMLDDKLSRTALTMLISKNDITEKDIRKSFESAELFLSINEDMKKN